MGHKKLARRRFVPLYPINILAGKVMEVSAVVQVLPPGWPGMRSCLLSDVGSL